MSQLNKGHKKSPRTVQDQNNLIVGLLTDEIRSTPAGVEQIKEDTFARIASMLDCI